MIVDPASEWGPRTRFLLASASSLELLRWLVEGGRANALALVEETRLAERRVEAGPLATKVYGWRGPGQALKNDAEVLALEGDAVSVLWSRRSMRQVRQVLVRPSLVLQVPLFVRRVAKSLVYRGLLRAGAAGEWWLFDCRHEAKPSARLWLSPELGLAGFFAELERRRLRWSVLRWWEALPARKGGDVDMLVHDDDLDELSRILDGRIGSIPLDVYAVFGSRGHSYGGACYYPSPLAAAMLERSVLNERGVRVLAPEDAFHALAYHALYHKGEASGLPSTTPGVRPFADPKHDFATILPAMARGLGFELAPTMEAIDELLAEHGWRPPRDTLRKWSRKNRWIRSRWFREHSRAQEPGLVVFVLRRRAIEQDLLPLVQREIQASGFEILRVLELDPAAAERVERGTRGGNWGRGDWPADGGPPACVIVGFDPAPLPLRRRFRRRYPDMDNGRIVEKRRIRDAVNATLPPSERSNLLHSSDNAEEALEYLALASPEHAAEIRALLP